MPTPKKIAERAHLKGVIESRRSDFFRQTGIVVEVIDARRNKLVYRNFAKGDVIKGISDSARAQRINEAVTRAIMPLFQK